MEQKCKKMDIISEDNRHPGDPMYDCRACILYAAENHIQLLKNNLSNEVWESGCEWVWQQIFPLSRDLTGKHSNQTYRHRKKVHHKHHGSGL